jgi:hypothetical protein
MNTMGCEAPAARLRRGDLVQVRSEAEIAASLDGDGMLGGLPFMDEMRRYCGRVARVARRAERICVEGTATMRRVEEAVFLEGLRCDGAAHGGCDRGCLLLWKEAWLRRVPSAAALAGGHGESAGGAGARLAAGGAAMEPVNSCMHACDDTAVVVEPVDACIHAGSDAAEPVDAGMHARGAVRCQSTELARASVPLPGGGLRQRLAELAAGESTPLEFVAAVAGAIESRLWRALRRMRPAAAAHAPVPARELQPGDLVQVRSLEAIASTLDAAGRNRGLEFCPGMPSHCGRRYRVARRVDRIIVESNGRDRRLRDTWVLEGVACHSCARTNEFFWRGAWLERVDP